MARDRVSGSIVRVEAGCCSFGCVTVAMGGCDPSVDIAGVRALVELVVVVVAPDLVEVMSVGTIKDVVGGVVWLMSQGDDSS